MSIKKIAVIATAIASIIALAFCLGACGNGKPDGKAFVGTWKIVEMSQDGQDLTDMLKTLEGAGAKLDIVINADGSALMELGFDNDAQKSSGSWTVDGAESINLTIDGVSAFATLQNGKMVFEQSGSKMICEKVS